MSVSRIIKAGEENCNPFASEESQTLALLKHHTVGVLYWHAAIFIFCDIAFETKGKCVSEILAAPCAASLLDINWLTAHA